MYPDSYRCFEVDDLCDARSASFSVKDVALLRLAFFPMDLCFILTNEFQIFPNNPGQTDVPRREKKEHLTRHIPDSHAAHHSPKR